MLQRLLAAPGTAGLDLEGPERLVVHNGSSPASRCCGEVFREDHELVMDVDRRTFGSTPGLRIELGAGVAPVSMSFPEVLATDVVDGPGLDRVLDAQAMDLRRRLGQGPVRAELLPPLPGPADGSSRRRKGCSPPAAGWC